MTYYGFFAFYVGLADKPAVYTDKDGNFTLFVAFYFFVIFYFSQRRRRQWHEKWFLSRVGWSQDQPIRGKGLIQDLSAG